MTGKNTGNKPDANVEMVKDSSITDKAENAFVFDPFKDPEKDGKWFSFNIRGNMLELKLTPISRSEIRKNKKQFTTVHKNPQTQIMYEVENPEKEEAVNEKALRSHIVDWKVYVKTAENTQEPWPFTSENLEIFLDKFGTAEVGQEHDTVGVERPLRLDAQIIRLIGDPGNFIQDDSENL